MSRTDLLETIAHTLSSFYLDFANNPFLFFYEEDARAHLFVRLDTSLGLVREYPKGQQFASAIPAPLFSSIVKAEYPQVGEVSRFDIAILDPNAHSFENFYQTPVSVAIELKLGSQDLGSDKTGHFKCDVKKLVAAMSYARESNRAFLGIALYLHQTSILDERRFRSYYADTFKTIDRIAPHDFVLSDNEVIGIIVSRGTEDTMFLCSGIKLLK
jgi:hypothetical protein